MAGKKWTPPRHATCWGWTETDPHEALARSVAWHLANPNPPEDASDDFSEDDKALAATS